MTMKAGTYYIGDLCYVLEDAWDEFCECGLDDGEGHLKDGRAYATYGTAYGDGSYHDQNFHEYGVDAGLIGCILVSDIKDHDLAEIKRSGNIVTFNKDFNTGSENGVIKFGHIVIDTAGNNDDEEEYTDEDEDYDD